MLRPSNPCKPLSATLQYAMERDGSDNFFALKIILSDHLPRIGSHRFTSPGPTLFLVEAVSSLGYEMIKWMPKSLWSGG